MREGRLSLVGIAGWSQPIVLRVVSHRDKREFPALTQFLELTARALGRKGAWEAARG